MSALTVITNHVPRMLLDACELTLAERAEFDYIDWDAVDRGEIGGDFFRYRGTTYDLSEFTSTSGFPNCNELVSWHGIHNDSFFSGIVVRHHNDGSDYHDQIVVGRYYC